MRIMVGGIMHETHTFSAEETTANSFVTSRGQEILRYAGMNHSMGGVLDEAIRRGMEVRPTFFADAVSSGPVSREIFDSMLGELTDLIRQECPSDGLVIVMHGAMVAEGHPDAEAEILRRVRDAVGTTPMTVTLDLHGNISQEMVGLADVIVGYDTYPHVDAANRAAEAVGLLDRLLAGEIRPTIALARPGMLVVPQAMLTARGPMRTLIDRAHEFVRAGQALSVSVFGGFPYADVPDAGMSFLVVTDRDREAAQALARELADLAWTLRGEFSVRNTDPSAAVEEAARWPEGPVVLVDIGDNIGGGTPGDGTVLVRELIRQGAEGAVVFIADPEATEQARVIGVGGVFSGLIGGKVDRLHGEPLHLEGQVLRLCDGGFVHQGPENAGLPGDMGPTAVLQAAGVIVVLTSNKVMPGDLQQLRAVGIEPSDMRIVVVKAAVRWRGGYESITRHSIDVATPGLGSIDLHGFCFDLVRRPVWPLDSEGFTDTDRPVSTD